MIVNDKSKGGDSMLKFKIDVIELLNENGYNSTKIRKEKLIGQQTYQDMKKGVVPGIKTINILCKLLEMQPGAFLKYVDD